MSSAPAQELESTRVSAPAFALSDVIPVVPVLLAVLAGFWYFYRQILAVNSGTFIYAQDDPYIHLSLARNLLHGWYGATSFAHSSPSSSVVWPFLLAGIMKFTGPNQMVALWIQVPLCLGILCAALWMLRDAGIRNHIIQTAVLFAVAAFTAFLPMAFIALEHLLHCLAMIVFCWSFARIYNRDPQKFDALNLGLLAALLTASRYEGLFTLAVAGLLVLRARRWNLAAAITIGGAFPVLAFGLYSLHIGGHLLPNSLLIKGQPLTWRLDNRLLAMKDGSHAAFALFLTLIGWIVLEGRVGRMLTPRTRTAAILLLGTMCFHGYFATWGWYTRYEAYLICFGTLLIAIASRDFLANPPRVRYWRFAVIALALPFIYYAADRAYTSTKLIPDASHDIFSQQYQVARLFQQFYRGQAVGVNDVGSVDWFAETNTQDVAGLTSYEFLNLGRFPGAYKVEDVLARHDTKAMAFYIYWVLPPKGSMHFPESWKTVATWDLKVNHVLWGTSVTIFAEGCDNARELSAHLAEFDPTLPKTIKVTRAHSLCGQPAPGF